MRAERGSASFSSLTVPRLDRKSTRLNSSHLVISYAVFCLKKKKKYCNSSHYDMSYYDICLEIERVRCYVEDWMWLDNGISVSVRENRGRISSCHLSCSIYS